MRRAFPLLLLPLALAGISGGTELDPATYIPIDEIRPGMVGEGLTSFGEPALSTFGVEVLAVISNRNPQGDLIVARLKGPVVDRAGNMSGMSGSPVYFGGRLAGAVAYAYPYSLEPLAGITPIQEMLELWDLPERRGGRVASHSADGPLRSMEAMASALGLHPPRPSVPSLGQPVPIPLSLTADGELGRVVSRSLCAAMATGSALREGDREPARMIPGAPVGVMMVDGDITMGATGTLTHRDGDRILAFGHPAFGEGGGRFPLTTAVVHTVVPSRHLSYKMASVGRPVGSVRQDRRAGAAAVLGPIPRMIPFRLEVRGGQRESFSYRIVDHPGMTPWLAMALTGNSLERTATGMGDQLYRVRMLAEIEGLGRREWQDVVMTGQGAFGAAAAALEPLSTLYSMARDPVPLQELTIHLEVEPGTRVLELETIWTDRRKVRPGESLALGLRFKPYGERPVTRRVRIPIPEDLRPGPLALRVMDRPTSQRYEGWRSPGILDGRSLGQLLQRLDEWRPGDELRIALARKGRGLAVGGRELPRMPQRLRALLLDHPQVGGVREVSETPIWEDRLVLPAEVRGQASLEIEVVEP